MPYVTLVDPLIDIVLISIGFNVCAYLAYGYVYKREFAKIAPVDIKLSLVEMLIVIVNFGWKGVVVSLPVLGEVSWWVWYIIVSIPVEVACFFAYKYYFRLNWSEMVGSAQQE